MVNGDFIFKVCQGGDKVVCYRFKGAPILLHFTSQETF